jgi:uncharacterized protein with PIN domain
MYIDTSCLVAFYVPEKNTPRVDKLIRNSDRLFISAITKVEFLSALNKKVRMELFSQKEARIVFTKFEEHLSKGFFSQININADHFMFATEILLQTNTALRTLDAIHLGIVQKERLTIASSDVTQLNSAKSFNIPTISI